MTASAKSGDKLALHIFAYKLMCAVYEIIHYLDENDLYQDWRDGLRDRIAKIAVIKRVASRRAEILIGQLDS